MRRDAAARNEPLVTLRALLPEPGSLTADEAAARASTTPRMRRATARSWR